MPSIYYGTKYITPANLIKLYSASSPIKRIYYGNTQIVGQKTTYQIPSNQINIGLGFSYTGLVAGSIEASSITDIIASDTTFTLTNLKPMIEFQYSQNVPTATLTVELFGGIYIEYTGSLNNSMVWQANGIIGVSARTGAGYNVMYSGYNVTMQIPSSLWSSFEQLLPGYGTDGIVWVNSNAGHIS